MGFLRTRGLFLSLDLFKEIQVINRLISSSNELERIQIRENVGE
jgi:hypothetical protein